MSDVYYTSNPSEYTKVEGLYVSERPPPGFIRGRDLSVVGMAGACVRGPLDPQEITSIARFLEIYGGRDYNGGALVGEVWKALANKPFGRLVVRRVAAAAAAAGTVNLPDVVPTDIVQADAASVGAWSTAANGGPTVAVEDATDGDAQHFNVRVAYQGTEVLYENLNTQAGQDNLAEVVGDDPGRLITLTKLADGRPLNAAGAALVGGSDGAVAAADYDAGLDDLAVYPGVSVVLVPEATPDQGATNGKIVALAAAVSDRMFLTWSGVVGQAVAAEVAQVATDITTRSDRIAWCYNAPYTRDPETGLEIATAPHVWMASILSQNDVDVHPGAGETRAQLVGIKRLASQALTRADLISLRAAGISTIEKLPGMFLFRSGVTTSLEAGKTEITRRRMADFLQLSAADRLRSYVRAKNTVEVRAQMAGELVAFSQDLKSQSRIIEDFALDQETVNTPGQRAQGIEQLLWRVRLIGHILHLVLVTEIGTGTVIEQAA